MKRSLLFIIGAFACVMFFACQKEDPNPSPVTCDSLTKMQILTQKIWEIDALIRSDNGVITEYKKGGQNSTGVTYQNLKLKFNANYTGTYTDEVGTVHTLNWSFTTMDERSMELVIGPPFANTFTWKMVEIKDKYLHSTSSYGSGLITVRYIQVP